ALRRDPACQFRAFRPFGLDAAMAFFSMEFAQRVIHFFPLSGMRFPFKSEVNEFALALGFKFAALLKLSLGQHPPFKIESRGAIAGFAMMRWSEMFGQLREHGIPITVICHPREANFVHSLHLVWC